MVQQHDAHAGAREEEGVFSKIGTAISEGVGGIFDALIVPSASNRSDCDKLVSDIFWYTSYGPLGPMIRDSWFGKN